MSNTTDETKTDDWQKDKQRAKNKLKKLNASDIKKKFSTGAIIKYICAIIVLVMVYFLGTLTRTVKYITNDPMSAELELVQMDLESYGFSERYISIVKTNLEKSHQLYKSQIGMLHAIIRTESDYRYWIDHPSVKNTSEVGIGLGGIFWSKWGVKLQAAGIVQNKTDLYMPDVSILAIGFIIDDIIKTHIKDITKYNIADIVAINYFGSGTWNGLDAQDYKNKLTKYTSDLWMKRMSVKIYDEYKAYQDSIKNTTKLAADSLKKITSGDSAETHWLDGKPVINSKRKHK